MSDAARQLIDDAWDCLDEDDLPGARELLEQARVMAPEDALVVAFSGVLAAVDGDVDMAVAALDRARALDPGDVRVILIAADLQLEAVGDPEAALRLVDLALAGTDVAEERVEALLLKADAAIAADDRDADARAALVELEELGIDDADVSCHIGDLRLTLGDIEPARRAYEQAIEAGGDAGAYSGLGEVCALAGDSAGRDAAWLETLRQDRAAPPVPWHVPEAEFQRIAEAALGELPARALELLENVAILVEGLPAEELVASGISPRTLGLFSGAPLTEQELAAGGSPEQPIIQLFQRNIERFCRDRDELSEEIRVTLLHETAHYFGMDEDELDELGLG